MALLQKESSREDAFSSDDFRMYEFKVRRCSRGRNHDWTECPFAHPGEKARRRDPRRFHYSGNECPEFRNGAICARGDACEFSHGIFESWLHPARYRTQPCKDGNNCIRKVCFFAHTSHELRVLPVPAPSHRRPRPLHIPSNISKPFTTRNSSPTSIFGLSVHSPPLSPPSLSSYESTKVMVRAPRKETLLREIVDSIGNMNIRAPSSSSSSSSSSSASLVKSNLFYATDIDHHWSSVTSFLRDYNGELGGGQGEKEEINGGFIDDQINNGPDLEWVNELLM